MQQNVIHATHTSACIALRRTESRRKTSGAPRGWHSLVLPRICLGMLENKHGRLWVPSVRYLRRIFDKLSERCSTRTE